MIVEVAAPGPLTTVQDLGRTGWRHLGVAACGALDPRSAALANRLVGNDAGDAVLEMTLHGPTLRFAHPATIAICGARAVARFDGAGGESCIVESGRPAVLPAGELRIGALVDGARAWLAIAGGIDVPVVLDSRSTDLRGGFGGYQGRALQAGDTLHVHAADRAMPRIPHMPRWWIDPDFDERGLPIRYVPSASAGKAPLDGQAWTTDARSNRQGVRFQGAALDIARREEISAPVAPGTVQLPPDGQPIVLLADAQTVGGYPRLGHVISADLPRLAQLRPSDTVRFQACDAGTATRLACAARARIARIALAIDHQLLRGNRE